MQTVQPSPPAGDTITVDQLEAERLSGLSYKSLERAAKGGEPVGRIKVGRRVLFIRKQLEAWINSKLSNSINN